MKYGRRSSVHLKARTGFDLRTRRALEVDMFQPVHGVRISHDIPFRLRGQAQFHHKGQVRERVEGACCAGLNIRKRPLHGCFQFRRHQDEARGHFDGRAAQAGVAAHGDAGRVQISRDSHGNGSGVAMTGRVKHRHPVRHDRLASILATKREASKFKAAVAGMVLKAPRSSFTSA